MRILIIYATNSGGTYVASRIIEDILSKKHRVTLMRAIDARFKDLKQHSVVLLGSPSWNYGGKEGQPQETMAEFMKKMKGKRLRNRRFAVFGCGDSSFTYFCGAADYMEAFAEDIGGKLILPSLRIDKFYFHLKENEALSANWARKLARQIER